MTADVERPVICTKCGATSGNDWKQCGDSCPLPDSPHYKAPADVELLPCPCGAAAAIHNTGVSAGPKEKVVVACVDPECHWSMTGYGTKQAATRWNRRANTAALNTECQTHREAHHRIDGILMGTNAFEGVHEGGQVEAWKNTIEAVKKLAAQKEYEV